MNGRNAAVSARPNGHNVPFMISRTSPTRSAGFALTEALTALLLLALATIGTGTAMVHSLAGQRSALLRTRAADLAADLAEALRSSPDPASRQAEIHAWEAAVMQQLPGAQAVALPRPALPGMPPCFDIHLQWQDGRATAAMLSLPVVVATALGAT